MVPRQFLPHEPAQLGQGRARRGTKFLTRLAALYLDRVQDHRWRKPAQTFGQGENGWHAQTVVREAPRAGGLDRPVVGWQSAIRQGQAKDRAGKLSTVPGIDQDQFITAFQVVEQPAGIAQGHGISSIMQCLNQVPGHLVVSMARAESHDPDAGHRCFS